MPRFLWAALMVVLPLLLMAAVSFQDALQVIWWAETMPAFESAELNLSNEEELRTVRQKIQTYFRKHDLYIPFDDINTSLEILPDFQEAVQNACGKGKLFVWIPLRIRMPLVGEKVVEWCWKPKVRR